MCRSTLSVRQDWCITIGTPESGSFGCLAIRPSRRSNSLTSPALKVGLGRGAGGSRCHGNQARHAQATRPATSRQGGDAGLAGMSRDRRLTPGNSRRSGRKNHDRATKVMMCSPGDATGCPAPAPAPAVRSPVPRSRRAAKRRGNIKPRQSFSFPEVSAVSVFFQIPMWSSLNAAEAGDVDEVRRLSSDPRVDLEAIHEMKKCTALWMSASEGHDECLSILLDAGADSNAVDLRVPRAQRVGTKVPSSTAVELCITKRVEL
jgi:hypothetical protein